MTAPMPHLGAPSGGYISDKYPNIHLIYQSAKGFVSLSRTRRTPYDTDWSPSDVLEDYSIRFLGKGVPFTCAPSMSEKLRGTREAD